MFTPEELAEIRRRLLSGEVPEDIAQHFGMGLSGFRAKLDRSGYQIRIWRDLEIKTPIEPVPIPDQDGELVAA